MSTIVTQLFILFSYSVYCQETGFFIDSRDGTEYKTVKIGDQVWMAENLYYDTGIDISFCAQKSKKKCKKYGRYYSYKSVMNGNECEGSQGACPDGWHVPTVFEWNTLFNYLGGEENAAKKINKRKTGFNPQMMGAQVPTFGNPGLNNNCVLWTSTEAILDEKEIKEWNKDWIHAVVILITRSGIYTNVERVYIDAKRSDQSSYFNGCRCIKNSSDNSLN